MFRFIIGFACVLAGASAFLDAAAAKVQIQPPAAAPPSGPLQILPPAISPDLRIVWEVKNRFRLFRREADFLRHVAAQSIKSVLAAEQIMAGETDRRGWGGGVPGHHCVGALGRGVCTWQTDRPSET